MADVTESSSGVVINKTVDQLLENMPVGSIARAISNNLYGLNIRGTPPAIAKNKDHYGYTFFTRPQLNMDEYNIGNYRGFYNLLTDNAISYQRYTRMMLDPRLGYNEKVKSPLVDNQNAFIPILSNTCVSLSGWPDLTVPTYTSDAGLYGQEYSFVDGVTNHYESFDIDVSFRNARGNPLIYFFYIWIKYQSLVFEGILNPYADMIIENEIDYNTRIYRLVMDNTKRYVRFIACTGASFPINVPTGNLFDYNVDSPYNDQNKEINIRFKCLGFRAFEDIIKLEFNETVGIFNPAMKKILDFDMDLSVNDSEKMRDDDSIVYSATGTGYTKIPYALAMTANDSITNSKFYNLNYRAYPYINLYTNELEWWIEDSNYNRIRDELSTMPQNPGNLYPDENPSSTPIPTTPSSGYDIYNSANNQSYP